MSENTPEIDADFSAAEARMARRAFARVEERQDTLEVARAKGRRVVDNLVRGTALLQPGEEVDNWIPRHKAMAVQAYYSRPRTPEQTAFFVAFCEAADEAIADLYVYKDKLYNRK